MTATGLILRKELSELVRDARLAWAGGLILLLLVAAIGVGWSQQTTLKAERVAGQALDYDAWLKQGPRHPHNAADQGMHVFKPASPLGVIDPGIDPYVGSTIWLQAHRQSETKFRPAQDATGLQRFGGLSPAWLLQVLSPLLIIILGFNAFAGEREDGTLRQILSLGVRPLDLLAGKAVALSAAVGLLLAPGLVLAAIAALASAGPERLTDVAGRLLLLGLGYGLYLGAAVFLVLAVSALCKTSRAALFALLALWIVGALVAPRAIADVAGKVYPAPSRLAFNGEIAKDLDAAASKAWISNFNVATAWDPKLPLGQWGRALQVDDRSGFGVLDSHFGRLWDTFERQQRLQVMAGLAAPIVAVRDFSMAMAGTDFAQHRDFSLAAERQRRLIQETVSHDLVAHADPLGDRHFSYKAGPELWAKVPRFDYRTPPLSFALARHWPALLVLALVFAATFGAARLVVSRRLSV